MLAHADEDYFANAAMAERELAEVWALFLFNLFLRRFSG
jgi:hypothetical protein